jgi:hypothetical protein
MNTPFQWTKQIASYFGGTLDVGEDSESPVNEASYSPQTVG